MVFVPIIVIIGYNIIVITVDILGTKLAILVI